MYMTDEEYNVLEDTMRVASMGAILFAEAGSHSGEVPATKHEVSAFMSTIERSLCFVFEGVSNRHN